MAAISSLIAGAAMAVGGAILGNQAKQKAKGQAGQVERDASAAQAGADAKLKQAHDANIQAQSQAGGVARKALGGTLDDGPPGVGSEPGTLLTPGSRQIAQTNGFVHTLNTGGRKALLGS